jgi:EmrB/QacA subfamily drug resistance transporter
MFAFRYSREGEERTMKDQSPYDTNRETAKSLPPTSETRQFSRRTLAFTLLGTMLVTFISALDQTIVGTALPRIVADLQGFDLIAWVTTIYLLTSTVTIPVYGKLSDLFGRKSIFMVALVIFLLGSALSGTAHSMTQLVIFRALQGIGAGGLQPLATAVVGDLFSPRERGKWIGITSSSYALASIIGPLVGGVLTDALSWRWVFYLNLPVGLITFVVLAVFMPSLRSPHTRIVIDYLGCVLLVLAILPLLLGFSWAGDQFAWVSWQSLGLFGSALLLLVLLVIYSVRQERRRREPVLEPSMFKDVRVFSISLLAAMLLNIVALGCVYFLPVFLQSVIGVSATNSGLVLIPLMLTSIVGAVLAGWLVTFTGRYKWVALTGAAITIAGVLLLLPLGLHTTSFSVVSALLVLGVGIGAGQSVYIITVQNAMPERIGQASSALVFFRQLGQSIGLAAIGSVVTTSYVPAFYAALPRALRQRLPSQFLKNFENPLVLLSPDVLAPIRTSFEHSGTQGLATFHTVLTAVKLGLAQSIHDAILLSLGLVIATFVVVLFLKEIPLQGHKEEEHLRHQE